LEIYSASAASFGRIAGVVVVIFGVSGAGKTTLGELLAREMRWQFYDADEFHSQANIDKMKRGIALTDGDRRPWLANMRKQIKRSLAAKKNAVLACSALKLTYRQILRVNDEVKFVYLRGSHAQVSEQMRHRHGHFMNPDLLQSQFDDLEEPRPTEDVIVIDLGRTPRELVKEIERKLALRK
jgi:gluconokinase